MQVRTKKETCTVKVNRDGEEWPFDVIPLDPGEEEFIRKKHTEYTRVRGQMMPEVDFIGIKIETTQKVIQSWPCVDGDNKDIPCTDENKKIVWLMNPDLINEVLAKAADIAAGRAVTKAEEKKT